MWRWNSVHLPVWASPVSSARRVAMTKARCRRIFFEYELENNEFRLPTVTEKEKSPKTIQVKATRISKSV